MSLQIKINSDKRLKYNTLEADILQRLDNITDMLHTLNSSVSNYFYNLDENPSSQIEKSIETIIDMVDNIYLDNIVKSICKRAVVDNFTKYEFEKQFIEFCNDCDIKNPESLIDSALDIFEEQKKVFENI